jgi:hypothetical protein
MTCVRTKQIDGPMADVPYAKRRDRGKGEVDERSIPPLPHRSKLCSAPPRGGIIGVLNLVSPPKLRDTSVFDRPAALWSVKIYS